MLGPKRGVVIKGFLVALIVKDAHAVLEAQLSSLGREDPLGRKWQPTPAFLPRSSHGQRSLEGYSPRGLQKPTEEAPDSDAFRPFIHF